MIKFRNLLKVCVDYKGRTICALNDECSDPIACVKEMLLAGKYWITKEETGEIFPPMPEELLEANAGLGLGTSASPASSISNTPISLVEPKRFFAARSRR